MKMVNYWIFVSTEYSDFNRGSMKETLKRASDEKKWPIGRKTLHRLELKLDDKAIIYLSGSGNQKFVGHVVLSSELQLNKSELFDFVGLKEVEAWNKYVKIKPLIIELDFIKNKEMWWSHLRSGVVKISESDYERILQKR